jgi:uncharacterized phage-associated protein
MGNVATVFDVAQFILSKYGSVEAMKLQKLVYYSQAWRAVQTGKPLFQETIKAYAQGPVVGQLWHTHRGYRHISPQIVEIGSPDGISWDEAELIESILEHYGHLSGDELSELTHLERPWVEAWARSYSKKIDLDSMKAYYAEQLVYASDSAPRIPTASRSYVASDALESILEEADVPDDISGLLSLIQSARSKLEA